MVEGKAAGAEMALDGDVLLGRSAGEPGNLGNDATLSRRHALIHAAAGGGIVLEDLGSHNGTRVNGQLISAPRALAAGDVIELGETTLELVAVGFDTEPPMPVPASREQATRLGLVPVEVEPPMRVPASREQATRLGLVPVEVEPPMPVPASREQATRLGQVPVEVEPPMPVPASREQATRLGQVPVEVESGEVPVEAEPRVPSSRERATRLGQVPVEVEPPMPEPSSREQATRLGQVPVGVEPPMPEPSSREQATRLGQVPVELEPEPATGGGWGGHEAPPTRVGPIPQEILAGLAPEDEATRLAPVATEPVAVAPEPAAEPRGAPSRPFGVPPADGSGPAGAEAPRARWWQRIFRR